MIRRGSSCSKLLTPTLPSPLEGEGSPPSKRSRTRMSMPPFVGLAVFVGLGQAPAVAESPFATRVIDYAPAPGQFVNDLNFNDPARALGPPVGGGTSQPNNESIVTLGGFGGSITLGFDQTVLDDPRNRFGLDAIVFGNAYWVGGNRDRHWAECATIEISLDANVNGLADDPWYLIPGSHIANAQVTPTEVVWDDDVNDATYPPSVSSWLPTGASGEWTTSAYELPASVFGPIVVVNPAAGTGAEAIFGYAEYSPTLVLGDLDGDGAVDDPLLLPEEFYTAPDDPFASGITPGSGGGDGFDIVWAIDASSGEPAGLPGFDFIRITTAVNSVSPVIGEHSAEIDAVSDVAPDPFGDSDFDGDIDLFDIAEFQLCFGSTTTATSVCGPMDRDGDAWIDALDASTLASRITGPK